MYRNLIDKTEVITPSLFLFYLLYLLKVSSIILDIYAFAPLGNVGSFRDYYCPIFKGREVDTWTVLPLKVGPVYRPETSVTVA